MVYDEKLASRIRQILTTQKGLAEKKMFGGIAFMLNGNMCCGVVKNDLLIRTGAEKYEKALTEPHVRPMDFTRRSLTGFVFVSLEGCRTDEDLKKWLKRAIDVTSSLPAK